MGGVGGRAPNGRLSVCGPRRASGQRYSLPEPGGGARGTYNVGQTSRPIGTIGPYSWRLADAYCRDDRASPDACFARPRPLDAARAPRCAATGYRSDTLERIRQPAAEGWWLAHDVIAAAAPDERDAA